MKDEVESSCDEEEYDETSPTMSDSGGEEDN
jgi:hypothetical protein